MSRRRYILVIILVAVLPLLILFLLPAPFALPMQVPAALAIHILGLTGVPAAVMSLIIDLLTLALLVAAISVGLTTKNRKAKFSLIATILLLVVLFIAIRRPEHSKTYTGLYEHGFERSIFYPDGKCWRPAYWVDAMPELDLPRNSFAVEVTFIGDTTPIGSYGHMGAYIRESRVIKVLNAKPAAPCH